MPEINVAGTAFTLSKKLINRIASDAECDTRTVIMWWRGKPGYGQVRDRVARAAKALGVVRPSDEVVS